MSNRQAKRQIQRDDYKRQKQFLGNKSENQKRMILLINAELEVIAAVTRKGNKDAILKKAQEIFEEIEKNPEFIYPPEFHNILQLMGVPVVEEEKDEE